MAPTMNTYDVILIQEIPFEEIQVGDIIVFDRPEVGNRIIVSRVVEIMNDEPKIIKAKKDTHVSSIPGIDFPVTEKEYFGKVVEVLKPKKYPQDNSEIHWFKDQETWIPILIQKVS